MWINLLMIVTGVAGGGIISGGMFALLVKLGVFKRIIELTRTAYKIRILETFIVLGGVLGNIFSVFVTNIPVGMAGVAVFGLFAGIYVGWLHMALAETFSMFSIVFRRLKLKYGLGLAVLFLSLGKLVGALLYFYNNWGNNL